MLTRINFKKVGSELVNAEGVILITLMAGMGLVVFWGVLVRYLPFRGQLMLMAEEGSRLVLIWLGFLGAAMAERENSHFRIEVVAQHMAKGRRGLLIDIPVLAFLVLFSMQCIQYCYRSLSLYTLNMQWPVLAFTLPMGIGSTLMCTYVLIRVISRVRH